MAAVPPHRESRRPRPGSLERPVSGRLYRGTWLLVGLPLLVAAFSVTRPGHLSGPALPPAFDRVAAVQLADELASDYPDRSPGSPGAHGAADWLTQQFAQYGLRTRRQRFSAVIPGYGRTQLENLLTEVPGRSPETIVVMAHRDDTGAGPGANDNASGTAALVELARAYANPQTPGARSRAVVPAHRIVFLSTDGGAFGGLGAARFVADSPYRDHVLAVVNLDSLAGTAPPRLEIAGDEPRSPAATLVETAAVRVAEQTAGRRPARPSALRQLVDLAFPFTLYEQGVFVGRGIPAVTLTSAADRPPPSFGDTPAHLDALRLVELGRAAQNLLGSLDQGVELAQGTSTYLYLGPRIVRGWALELVLVAALLPFFAAAVDLFARCRRRRIPLAPALRSLRSRLYFWTFVGVLFGLFALAGAWPGGAPRPLDPESGAGTRWPRVALGAIALLVALGWLVGRDRLLPRRRVRPEEELAGHTAALLALGVVALLVVATNPFALLFLLPSLHAWLWLPQVRDRPAYGRAALFVAGLAGPLLLLASFAGRFGLGYDAPWYLAELTAVGYVPWTAVALTLAWAAGGAQLAALAAGRYAPYPSAAERRRRGPIRETVRRVVLGIRARRRASDEAQRALHGS